MPRSLPRGRDNCLSPYRGDVDPGGVATIEVRPVRVDEYAAAGEVTARAFHEYAPTDPAGWAEYLARIADVAGRSSRAPVLVALDRGVIAGTVTIEVEQRIDPGSNVPLDPDDAHIRMLGVDPDHRGRGVARSLTLACVDLARARGKQRVTLDTAPQMHAAQALYAGLGFRRSGTHLTRSGFELLSFELALDRADG